MKNVWLIGAGEMASDYFRVLHYLACKTTVIGRGEESAKKFSGKFSIPVHEGGINCFLNLPRELPDAAIVSVGVEALAETATSLIKYGVKRILLEKPGSLNYRDICDLNELAKENAAEVFIAYNRRMYASVIEARKLIKEDGGVLSMNFEFTEWGHIISPLKKGPGIKEAWLLGNSTHVIDLAFYLGGNPVELTTFTGGTLDWHPTSAIFVGAGRTEHNVLFSYNANWMSPGRWGVEILTENYRFILRPLEALQFVKKGSVAVESHEINDHWDKMFKPGLYEQTVNFLNGNVEELCSIDSQVSIWPFYAKMANYSLL